MTKPIFTDIISGLNVNSQLKSKIALNLAKILAVLIGMIWNFVLYSKFVFVRKIDDQTPDKVSGS
jgi:putative flippase GtrA